GTGGLPDRPTPGSHPEAAAPSSARRRIPPGRWRRPRPRSSPPAWRPVEAGPPSAAPNRLVRPPTPILPPTRSPPPALQIRTDHPGGVGPRGSGDPATGMGPGPAQVQAGDGHAIPSEAEQRTPGEELVQPGFAVQEMPLREAIVSRQVHGREHLPVKDQARDPRGESFQ